MKKKRCGIIKSKKIRIILYLYFCYTVDKKVVWNLVSYKFLEVHHSLFYTVHQSFLNQTSLIKKNLYLNVAIKQ